MSLHVHHTSKVVLALSSVQSTIKGSENKVRVSSGMSWQSLDNEWL